MEDNSRYHWTEGMKFAHEGIKTLCLPNGAATVSVLTFIGDTKSDVSNLHTHSYAMLSVLRPDRSHSCSRT